MLSASLDAGHASAFADAVEHAPEPPSGTFSCPADDASSVTVFLTYPGRTDAEVVRVHLTGCRGLGAPGRTGLATAGLEALRPFPKGWS